MNLMKYAKLFMAITFFIGSMNIFATPVAPIEAHAAVPRVSKFPGENIPVHLMGTFNKIYYDKPEDIFFPLDNTVGDLKNKIERKYNIPAKDQKLKYRGQVLNDSQTIKSLNITGFSPIQVIIGE